ncbi:alpha-ketoglutarate-dependent dioxygenase AlkB [Mucilaginibacter sp. PAMB04168]|uniref:alpha-ketoglutarate-dependent dioxygenase AlkB n=1 Tax=Mucilaginibacter sp. PAMB04168 TaxID=3138567 RepID=UPI0031F64EBC
METAVPGLFLYPDFIDEAREEQLLNEIDSQTWIVDYLRRLQYYGYRNELDKPYDLIPFPVTMPPLMHQLSQEMVEKSIILLQPDQVIINEYVPGEGIKPHKDRAYYENQICGVNLGSGCIMRFIRGKNEEVIDVEIPRRSVYVMQDDARKKWKHAIPPRKKDNIDGNMKHRERRVSITYRKVKPKKVRPINPEGKVAKLLDETFGISLEQLKDLGLA